ncbi:MAG TPA: hypothetical protein VI612_01980 [Candidatus Nanoarchaeia archaeon]|nr:hypothetical protein [Candidatus Nanoarchaeia archaeon]
MRLQTLMVVAVLLCAAIVMADGSHEQEFAEGKRLVESGAKCDTLTGEELEAIGEYFMEQMHPGEAHDQMHKMMGMEEGTEYHDQFHVNMAKMMYCGEGGMMPMMMDMMGGGMMGPGMMGGYGGQMMGGYGMMGSTIWGFGSVLWTLIFVGLLLVVWLWVFKLWRDLFGRR